jgi:hypothetical protein
MKYKSYVGTFVLYLIGWNETNLNWLSASQFNWNKLNLANYAGSAKRY